MSLHAQVCPTLCDHMDCSLPGCSVFGIIQARILEWVTIPFSRGSSWPRYEIGYPILQSDSLLSEPPEKLKWGNNETFNTYIPILFVKFFNWSIVDLGFPGGSAIKNQPAYTRPRFDPWVKKILWRRDWGSTPVFLPGEFHGQRSLAGYSLCGHKEHNWATNIFSLCILWTQI